MRLSILIKAQKLMEVEKLSKAMTEIHAQVAEKATRDRKASIQKHNDKMHVRSPNFQVGDYVLVASTARAVRLSFRLSGRARAAPRREFGVRLRVRRRASTHERSQSRARNTLEIL
jgi:hypothetical protein